MPLRRFLVLYFVILTLASSTNYSNEVYAGPSNLLIVPYHAEERPGFCGPTSVQMVLEYLSGNVTEQKVLATEMKTNKMATSRHNVVLPFQLRGYNLVSENYTSVEMLKEWNMWGHVSIILIWFDTNHKSSHYVVVTGYNETGILINDPYPLPPSSRPQPHSRRTGMNAFISYGLLENLWAYSHQWALQIPYPNSGHYAVAAENPSPIHLVTVSALTISLTALLIFLVHRRKRVTHH